MKSWLFHGTNKPLTLEEVPEPKAGPDEVVVDVKAAGICHSDVSAMRDPSWMYLWPTLPHTLGHENAGVISEVGENLKDKWHVGDRVGMAPMMPDGSALGYVTWEGGFGPKLRATDYNLVKIPDGVSYELAAMATDAGLTSYHAVVTRGKVEAGMKVGIIGLGGLGYIGAQIARMKGAEVYGVDISEAARALKDELGLTAVAESIMDFQDVGLNLIVDFAGFGTTTAEAIEAIGMDGRYVFVGLGKTEATINTFTVITKHLDLVGSQSGTKQDLEELYELMRSGELNPPMNLITHDQVPEALDKLEEGGVVGRFIIQYDAE